MPMGIINELSRTPLAQKDLVCRNYSPARQESVASTSVQGPAVPGSGTNMASMARNLGSVSMAPERAKLMAIGLPTNVTDTIQSARAASTQGLYTLKWRIFETWSEASSISPFQSLVADIQIFLQELLGKVYLCRR